MEVKAVAMALVELPPSLALVNVEIVEHDVDVDVRPARAATRSMWRSISSPLRVASPWASTALVHVQRCQERLPCPWRRMYSNSCRASRPRRRRSGSLRSISLYAGLLVCFPRRCCTWWRLEIELADFGNLLAEQRIKGTGAATSPESDAPHTGPHRRCDGSRLWLVASTPRSGSSSRNRSSVHPLIP